MLIEYHNLLLGIGAWVSCIVLYVTSLITFTCLDKIGIDDWLRVPAIQDAFAIGDCAGFRENTGKPVLPALAQVKCGS